MNGLSPAVEDLVIAHLRAKNPALNEDQARLDLRATALAAKEHDQLLKREGKKKPQSSRVLILLYAELYCQHTAKVDGEKLEHRGGNIIGRLASELGRKNSHKRIEDRADLLLRIANDVGLTNWDGEPYTAGQINSAIHTMQKALREKFDDADVPASDTWRRQNLVADQLKTHIVGYVSFEGEDWLEPSDYDGWAVIEGYQPSSDPEEIKRHMFEAIKKFLAED